jgi:hypothetical protein
MEFLEGQTLKHRIQGPHGRVFVWRRPLRNGHRHIAFFGGSLALVVDAILHCSPLPLRQLNPVILPALEVVINKALEKDRRLRYQSAAEMRTDINQLKRDAESVRTTTASSELETNSSGPAASATVAYHLTEPPPVSVRARHLNRAVIAFAALLVFSFAVAGWLHNLRFPRFSSNRFAE